VASARIQRVTLSCLTSGDLEAGLAEGRTPERLYVASRNAKLDNYGISLMSSRRDRRKAERAQARQQQSVAPVPRRDASRSARQPVTGAKRTAFLAVTVLFPFVLLALLEISLRVAHYGRETPLFEPAADLPGNYLQAGHDVAARFFPTEQFPPSPPNDVFLASKPAHSFRLFVLGESSAAGFPYPPNAMFSRVVADALRDVLPADTVEVVNLGIAATNTYAIVDFVGEIIDQHPDVVMIYAGHNEYYGALGVGSTESLGSFPSFIRLYLKLQRLRTFVLLRNAIGGAAGLMRGRSASPDQSPSRMESIARDQQIVLGGKAYRRGVTQFDSNLRIAVRRLRAAGVSVFIGSLVSDLRDQPPLSALSSGGKAGVDASAAYREAQQALASGDSAKARTLFIRARDLDQVRFRAPTEFNSVVQRVVKDYGAFYVPVEESFSRVAQHGIPGHDLILEHVHPNSHGYALMGREFFSALASSGVLRGKADLTRLKPWDQYEQEMALTAIDQRIAAHEVNTVITRWPFVPFSKQTDYRGTYQPVNLVDSLAFLVARGGMRYPEAKLQLARSYEARNQIDSALDEYAGLIRDLPRSDLPSRYAAEMLLKANQPDRAIPYLELANRIRPTATTSFTLGTIALRAKQFPRAIAFLETSVALGPSNAEAFYQLSLAYAFSHDIDRARAAAVRAAQLNPSFPGLAGWLAALGVRPG
jgi:tetratricopeptide (TPR) repeat protein